MPLPRRHSLCRHSSYCDISESQNSALQTPPAAFNTSRHLNLRVPLRKILGAGVL